MEIATLMAIIPAGYLLGSIPVGFLVARAKGIDIRQHGSGNIGATNVFRTLGKGFGIFVFVCDALKGVLAVVLARVIYMCFVLPSAGSAHHVSPRIDVVGQGSVFVSTAYAHVYHVSPWIGIIGGIACILGHNFPVWLKFKGGKGVATSLGVVIGLVPLAAAISFATWGLVLLISGYVSLASIIGAVVVPVIVLFTASALDRTPLLVFTVLAAFLIVVRHRANIRRLLNGTEHRFKKTK